MVLIENKSQWNNISEEDKNDHIHTSIFNTNKVWLKSLDSIIMDALKIKDGCSKNGTCSERAYFE